MLNCLSTQFAYPVLQSLYERLDEELHSLLENQITPALKQFKASTKNVPKSVVTLSTTILNRISEILDTAPLYCISKQNEESQEETRGNLVDIYLHQGTDKTLNVITQIMQLEEKRGFLVYMHFLASDYIRESIKSNKLKEAGAVIRIFNLLKMYVDTNNNLSTFLSRHKPLRDDFLFINSDTFNNEFHFQQAPRELVEEIQKGKDPKALFSRELVEQLTEKFLYQGILVDTISLSQLLLETLHSSIPNSFLLLQTVKQIFKKHKQFFLQEALEVFYKNLFLEPETSAWQLYSATEVILEFDTLDWNSIFDFDTCKFIWSSNVFGDVLPMLFERTASLWNAPCLLQRIMFLESNLPSNNSFVEWWQQTVSKYSKEVSSQIMSREMNHSVSNVWETGLDSNNCGIFVQGKLCPYPCLMRYLVWLIEGLGQCTQEENYFREDYFSHVITTIYLPYEAGGNYPRLLSLFFVGLVEVKRRLPHTV